MKKIEAIIRPYKLVEVQQALAELEITGMTIGEVKGLGRQKGHTENYRGIEFHVNFVPKIKLELLIKDEQLDDCIQTIMQVARTGNIGDGKIIVTNIDEVYRIRTNETAEEAL